MAGSTAALRNMADHRIRGRGDLEAQLGVPVLAAVPRTRREHHDETALVTLAVPDGPAAEAYRRLRARILAMADRWGLKTVMVAGPTSGSATTAIAANLAVSMASTGRRVALLSTDLRLVHEPPRTRDAPGAAGRAVSGRADRPPRVGADAGGARRALRGVGLRGGGSAGDTAGRRGADAGSRWWTGSWSWPMPSTPPGRSWPRSAISCARWAATSSAPCSATCGSSQPLVG